MKLEDKDIKIITAFIIWLSRQEPKIDIDKLVYSGTPTTTLTDLFKQYESTSTALVAVKGDRMFPKMIFPEKTNIEVTTFVRTSPDKVYKEFIDKAIPELKRHIKHDGQNGYYTYKYSKDACSVFTKFLLSQPNILLSLEVLTASTMIYYLTTDYPTTITNHIIKGGYVTFYDELMKIVLSGDRNKAIEWVAKKQGNLVANTGVSRFNQNK